MRDINSLLLEAAGGGVAARGGPTIGADEISIKAGTEADFGKPPEEEKKSPRGWDICPEEADGFMGWEPEGTEGFMALKPSRSEKSATMGCC